MGHESLLTVGALGQILEGQKPANPVLQIIGYKPMSPDQIAFGSSSDELRYRLMIGDGIRAHQYCVITNQDIVDDLRNDRLQKWSIIRVTSYQTTDYGEQSDQKRRLIYILNLQLVKAGQEVGKKLVCQQPPTNLPQTPILNSNGGSHNQSPVAQPNSRPLSTNNYIDSSTTQPKPYPIGGSRPDLIRSPRAVRGSMDSQTIGIGELTPYIGKWIVKGRVTSKGAIREYNNAKGGGKLFNFTMADKTGEIKITAFNADCERVFGYVEPNKVYLLGRATVKNADKRYTTADFEITLNNDSLLEEVSDSSEASDIPLAKFNFVSIGSLSSLPPNQPVDLIGAIREEFPPTTVVSRTKNKELKKREIIIVDMSRHTINVTIWGDLSESLNLAVGDIFVTKSARIGTYGGRSASAGDCVFINPDIPEVRKLKSWYDKLIDDNFTALSARQEAGPGGDQWRSLTDLLDMSRVRTILSSGNQSALYGKTKGTLLLVGKNPVYKCCPTDNCGKKLVDTQNGELKCEKCQQTYSNYKYRYKTDVEIADHTKSAWVTLWDEKAEGILGLKPDELERFMKMENKEAYEKIITKPNFKPYIFTLRSRIDTYGGEERVKLTVINLVPLDCQSYAKRLIEEIKDWDKVQ